ncbi:hypothetical protein BH10ACT11_BH10ACT11_07150 [soil metagenome]
MRTRITLGMAAVLAVVVAATGFASTQTATKALSGEFDSVTAKCPSGTSAVLGGMKAEFTANAYSYIGALTRPSSRKLRAGSYVGSLEEPELTAIATCAPGPKSSAESKKTRLGVGVESSATATCPHGDRIVFGGFRGDLTGMNQYVTPLVARAKAKGEKWKVTGLNEGQNSAGDLTAVAYCGNAKKVKERSDTEVLGAYPDEGTASATCKKSERLAFGGFDVNVPGTSDDYVTIIEMKRKGSRTWSVTATNDGAPANNDVTAYAYCAKRRR